MNELKPHHPNRPMLWPEVVLELREQLLERPEEIYIVGGAVRDAMLHRPLHDIDLATSGDGIRLARKIANLFNGDFFILDEGRGVGRALIDTPDGRLVADVARFRGDTLYDDLIERDFTINAMAVDLKADLTILLDPLNGEQDIVAKLVRQCKPGALEDDPVRTLRAVRQSIQLGMRIEAETLRRLRLVVPQLDSISPERIRDEWVKMLSLPRPAAALRVADSVGLLSTVVPEVRGLHSLLQPTPYALNAWEHTLAVIENLTGILATLSFRRTDNTAASFSFGMIAIQLDRFRQSMHEHMEKNWPNERPHRALIMLAGLLQGTGKLEASQSGLGENNFWSAYEQFSVSHADVRAEGLRLSNAEKQWVLSIVRYGRLPLQMGELTSVTIHRFWRQTGETGIDICLFSLAEFLTVYSAQLPQIEWLMAVERVRVLLEAFFEKYNELIFPSTLIDGNQLIKHLGLKPGKIIGELLDHIRELQVMGTVKSFGDALQAARDYITQNYDN